MLVVNTINKMSGKKALLLIITVMLTLIGLSFHFYGYEATWHLWNIPTIKPFFADLRTVINWSDAVREGRSLSLMDYPPLWLSLGRLGIKQEQVPVLAFLLLLGHFISLFVFAKGYDCSTSFYMAIAIFSPAAMLCYERANVDLLIFVLLAFMLAVDRYSPLLAIVLLELSAILKLFSIFGLGYLLRETRQRFFLLFSTGACVFIIYLMLIWRNTNWMVMQAPKGSLLNYGVSAIGYWVFELTGSKVYSDLTTILMFVLAFFIIVYVLYLSDRFNLSAKDNRYIDAFRIGTLIYFGTFLQGTAFNYKFIFLIFSIPQVVLWIKSHSELRRAGAWSLAFVLLSCWGMILSRLFPLNLAFALDEFANWLAFACLLFLFVSSSPDWVRLEIRSFFERYKKKTA